MHVISYIKQKFTIATIDGLGLSFDDLSNEIDVSMVSSPPLPTDDNRNSGALGAPGIVIRNDTLNRSRGSGAGRRVHIVNNGGGGGSGGGGGGIGIGTRNGFNTREEEEKTGLMNGNDNDSSFHSNRNDGNGYFDENNKEHNNSMHRSRKSLLGNFLGLLKKLGQYHNQN